MKCPFVLFLLFVAGLSAGSESVMFDPPSGWKVAHAKELPRYVEAMVVGESRSNYPPSINLGVEDFTGSLKEYLKIVKKINEVQKTPWKGLGSITTQAGPADLSTADIQTAWGPVKLIHVILVQDGRAIILTGAAKKEEFTTLYPVFLKSMRTLRFGTSPILATNTPPLSAPCCSAPIGTIAN